MIEINAASLTISAVEWRALMPLAIVALGALFTLLIGTFSFSSLGSARKIPVFASGLAVLIAALAWLVANWQREPLRVLQGMVALDYFSSYCFLILLVSGILVLLSGYRYLEEEKIHYSEYYSIFLFAILGMMSLVVTLELVTLFIALELMSLAVYVLVGLRRNDRFSNEAAAKYFVMGGVASAIYLYGVALVYGALNSTNLSEIALRLAQDGVNADANPVFYFGAILLFVGFFFKVAVVPFHMWTPDVYEGAPSVVTSFMSTALKVAAFAAFVRVSSVFFKTVPMTGIAGAAHLVDYLHNAIWVLALLTMVIGNFVALMQDNLKRMLAYSAIAHTGYLMLGILVGPKVGYSGMLVYFIPYCVMNIGAFAVISIFSGAKDENAKIESLAGIGYRHPFLGATMAIFLFSLAGLPPTGGFVGKYFLFSSALEAGEIVLVLLAVVTSLVSVYYYLRVVIFMYMREPQAERSELPISRAGAFSVAAICLCSLLVIFSGVNPAGIVHMARKAAIALAL